MTSWRSGKGQMKDCHESCDRSLANQAIFYRHGTQSGTSKVASSTLEWTADAAKWKIFHENGRSKQGRRGLAHCCVNLVHKRFFSNCKGILVPMKSVNKKKIKISWISNPERSRCYVKAIRPPFAIQPAFEIIRAPNDSLPGSSFVFCNVAPASAIASGANILRLFITQMRICAFSPVSMLAANVSFTPFYVDAWLYLLKASISIFLNQEEQRNKAHCCKAFW